MRLPPRTVSIPVGRSVLRRVITFRDEDAASSFLVAITEILANAIDEHDRLQRDAPIVLEVEYGACGVVRVTDQGSGIADDALPHGTFRPTGQGRGLALAYAFVPQMSVSTGPEGTTFNLPLDDFGSVR